MKHKVEFGEVKYFLDIEDQNATDAQVRAALAGTYPAAAHAHLDVLVDESGVKTFRFTQKAGTKG